MHGEIGDDLIEFAKFSIEMYGLKMNPNHPITWSKMLENYKREHYVRRAGMIWIHKTICDFFNEDVDVVRGDSREEETAYARNISMFFMTWYHHKHKDIAKFYGCTSSTVTAAIKRINKILDGEDFHRKKVLQVLKYQIL